MSLYKELKNIFKIAFFHSIKNYEVHRVNHINYGIDRAFELSKNKDIDVNMLYTVCAYHDIGYYINSKNYV